MDPQIVEILVVVAGLVGAGVPAAYLLTRRGRKKDDAGAPTPPPAKPRPDAPTWDDAFGPAEGEDKPAEAAETPRSAAPADADPAPQPAADPAQESSLEAVGEQAAEAHPVEESAPAAPVTEDANAPAETPQPEPAAETPAGETAAVEVPEAPADRMVRLRARLARSGGFGKGLLSLLTSDKVDANTWDEIEETLLLADLGPQLTDELLETLKERMLVLGSDDPAQVRAVLREELLNLVDVSFNRRIASRRVTNEEGREVPAVVMMVGVNGTGKTTTAGKLARVLVAQGRSVVLGAADTFRAAAAEQLQTWGERVGVPTVRSDKDGADPAAVAFDAVRRGVEETADVVIVDTAGRLQNKRGLMDELGKVRRVAEKGLGGAGVQEALLVIDATTGQNGMQQARVFSEVVQITGIALTKLDGTAKGGIVMNVQRELGVPVKLVGLGEGMDDLAPFDPYGFVDALLGEEAK
ncbi:signal recognition particle-docking protein FtsY [Dermabacteraceae bacterium CCM 9519]